METALDIPAASMYSPQQQQEKVFAILTSCDNSGQIKGNRRNFIDLINVGTQMGFIVYVLPVERLSLQGSRQRGFVYQHASNRWVQRLMPFPNIIYNRIPNREIERRSYVKHKLRACRKDPRTTIFNPYFFNKWELFKWLKASSAAKGYLPHTRRFSGPGTLEKMLKKHPFLYLKPESGKAGKGIMMISHKPDSTLPYRLNIQEKTSSTTYNCVNFNKLWSRVSLQMEKTPYIVQQGIDLVTYRNRKFDLRVLVQKNIHGQWEMTGLGARVAGSTSITTHVPRGGRIEEPSKLLAYAFNTNESHNIVEKVSMAAVTIASQIEKHSNHRLGEMSMDIGVDTSGDVWFFEANSKPMKFDEPHIRQKSLQRIFQYSQYLLEN